MIKKSLVPQHPRLPLAELPTLTPEERAEGKLRLTQHIKDFIAEHGESIAGSCALADRVVDLFDKNCGKDPILHAIAPVNWLPTLFVMGEDFGGQTVNSRTMLFEMLHMMSEGKEPTTGDMPPKLTPRYKEALKRCLEFWRPERDFSALSDTCERLRSKVRHLEVPSFTGHGMRISFARDIPQQACGLLRNLMGEEYNEGNVADFQRMTTVLTEKLVYGLHNYNLDRILANALVNPDLNYAFLTGKIDNDTFNRYSVSSMIELDRKTQTRGEEIHSGGAQR